MRLQKAGRPIPEQQMKKRNIILLAM